MRRLVSITLLIVLGIALAPTGAIMADGIIIPPPGPVGGPEWLTIEYHRVHVTIENQIATTRVDQVFANETNVTAEGTYVFPLPAGAVVSDFVMWVDGEPVEAQILERDEARRIYDDIVRRMRDPALLEYVGTNMIQASVFPIPPGEERRIELEYSQVLPVEQGMVHYVYPLNTERFSARPLEEVVISVEVSSDEPISTVYSDTHDIAVSRQDSRHFRVGYEAYDILPENDFSLRYSLSREYIDVNLLTYRESAADPGFFLLIVTPPVEADEAEIVSRDIILVLDQSGSMYGEKWEQALGAAQYVLENLNPEDRFNVITFSTGWRIYSNELQPPSQAQDAIDWIYGLEAVGGTDINGALLEALSMVDRERPTVILFLTDGLPTEGETDISRILENVAEAAPSNVRIFAFGVGYDVDTVLLDSLVREHRGSSAYVREGERIDDEVSALYSRIGAPVLSDIEIDFGDIRAEDLYPTEPLPDLFAGSQMIIVGRYRDGGTATITLRGTVDGEEQVYTYRDLTFRENAGGEPFIPRLWATRKIGYLMNQIRLHGENQELIDSIVNLSIRYGIITPYTSFLIQEEDIIGAPPPGVWESGADMLMPGAAVGAAAVERAEFEAGMGGAAAPMPMPTAVMGRGGEYVETGQIVRVVNAKTFVRRNGVWVDVTYDPEVYTPVQVVFLSDEYFDLVAQMPELGDYFALGTRVIVVYQGVAYEVVEDAAEVPNPDGGAVSFNPAFAILAVVGTAAVIQILRRGIV